MQPFRIEPNQPASAYDTYGIVMPKETHTRVASCHEVDCEAYARGWMTKVDVGTEIGVKRARYIIDHSGRTWTAEQAGGLVTFTFPPGQECFAEHRVALERDPLYTIKRGDWRTYGSGSPVSTEEWLNRFGENQATLKQLHDRG
jgi:hypothetical protein